MSDERLNELAEKASTMQRDLAQKAMTEYKDFMTNLKENNLDFWLMFAERELDLAEDAEKRGDTLAALMHTNMLNMYRFAASFF